MAVYTLFSQGATGVGLTTDATAYTMGVQFSVTSPGCTLTGIWFYSASGAGNLPATIALYQVSGTSLVTSQAASWSGAAGSGWVRAAFSSPPPLTSGTAYKACVYDDASGATVSWYSHTASYWSSGAGSGGITSGPLSAPADAGASPGQDSFNSGTPLTYPASTFSGTNYWVDPEVTAPAAALPALPPLMPPGLSSPAAWQFPRRRGGAVTTIAGSGGVTVPKPSLSGSGTLPPPPTPVGSWYGLDSVLKHSRQEFEYYVSRPPVACPNCGEPLSNAPATKAGSGVQLYCRYDFWQYPRDWTPPSRPMPGLCQRQTHILTWQSIRSSSHSVNSRASSSP